MALPPRAGLSEHIQIFQDTYFNQATPMISHAPMPSAAKPPAQRRIHSAHNSHSGSIVISPPVQQAARRSPHKSTRGPASASLSPLKPSQRNKLNMVSFKPPTNAQKPTDSIQKKQPLMSRFKTVAQKLPSADAGSAAAFMGKENSHPAIFPAPPGLNLSIENYYQKAPGKRLLEPAPIKDGRSAKKQRIDDGPLPPHDSFPPIIDDGLKPGHSYAMLIGMAILRSPSRKLTLSQIYKWISDTYSFYNPQDAGWQNSIRHNLSLNKAFVKQERPKDDPGKGNYWAIEPGMEYLFMKDKASRKPAGASDSVQVMSTTVIEPSLPPMPTSFQEPALPPQLPPMPSLVEPLSVAPAAAAAAAAATSTASHKKKQPELSSDATIIASDTALPEDQLLAVGDKAAASGVAEPPTDATILDSSLYSPIPAAALHSSPPISRHIDVHSGTPPPVPRAPLGSSVSRSRKRKSASVDDSGYISSLESSALRSNQNTRHLVQEGGDRSRIKRGRAEEEIARLRASSYDSPTKNRSRNNGYQPTSSSPLRNESTSGHMPPPPLTPAVKLKAPPKPPPSVSPGTNLRMHRDKVRHMLASPLRRITSTSDDTQSWGSPTAFDESLYNFTDETDFALDTTNLGNAFEIFQDDSLPNMFTSMQNGSPVKPPSSKRLRMDRSHSVSALSEVTNSATRRSITSAPFLKVPNQSPGLSVDTPSKFFENLPSSPSKFFSNLQSSPSKMPCNTAVDALAPAMGDENSWAPLDEFCSPELFQDVDDFGGLDILQGFEKIGASIQPQQLFSAPPVQPQLMPYQQPQRQQHQQHARSSKGTHKTAFSRSYTSTF